MSPKMFLLYITQIPAKTIVLVLANLRQISLKSLQLKKIVLGFSINISIMADARRPVPNGSRLFTRIL